MVAEGHSAPVHPPPVDPPPVLPPAGGGVGVPVDPPVPPPAGGDGVGGGGGGGGGQTPPGQSWMAMSAQLQNFSGAPPITVLFSFPLQVPALFEPSHPYHDLNCVYLSPK